MSDFNFEQLLLGRLLDLISDKAIKIPTGFHARCAEIEKMLSNDITGIIKPLLNYSGDSASEAKYRMECGNDNLEEFLNNWFSKINDNFYGKIPIGLEELAKEYFKERWNESSLCLLRIMNWQEVEFNGNKIWLPKTLFFVKGSSVYVKTDNEENFKLGSYEYYLDSSNKNKLPVGNQEKMIVSLPFSRWYSKYPTPYLISNGVLKNYKSMEALQDKGDEVITKALPYLLLNKYGNDELLRQKAILQDKDLEKIQKDTDEKFKDYKKSKGKVPVKVGSYDETWEHLIPDLGKIVKEDLYNQSYRALLAGMGFIDIISGISNTRQQSMLNPKPFISQINAGVNDFKSLFLQVIKLVNEKNIEAAPSHRKLFSDSNKLTIVSSPIKINTEQILDIIRSGYDRGSLSIQSFVESIGFDFDTERQRRQQEYKDGVEDDFYPHIIQNREDIPDNRNGVIPAVPRKVNETNEIKNRKKGTPEANNFKNASEEIAKCKGCGYEFDYLSVLEAGMGYVKCPKCQETVTQKDIIEKAVQVTEDDIIKAKENLVQEELKSKKKDLMNKQEKLLNKMLGIEDKVEAITKDDLEQAPYDKSNLPAFIKKMPAQAQEIFISTFNSVYEKDKDEGRAMAIGISSAKRWCKKNGYVYNKETKSWNKK